MPRQVALSILSGLLLALPFCDARLSFLSWLGFIPLFSILKPVSPLRGFLFSCLTGLIFWLLTVYWLEYVTLAGMLVLVGYLALYFGVFGLFASFFLKHQRHLFFIPCLWVLLEYIRAFLFTGFGWALLGYSQYLNLPVIQVADFAGAWGVSFAIVLVNLAIFMRRKYFFAGFLVVAFILIYGHLRLSQPVPPGREVRIGLVQVNVPEELKLDPGASDYIIDAHLGFSRQAAEENPDLIIWPEAALPFVLEQEPEVFSGIKYFAKETGRPLLTGIVTERNQHYYNSVILLDGKGEISGRYDKVHLVPFGEYVPLKNFLPFLNAIVPIVEVTRGNRYTVFSLPDKGGPVKFSTLICFEDLFPEISRAFLNKGAQFLVNISNDSWYKISPAGVQHLQASVFRAVENHVALVRATNGGVSAFITAHGKIRYLAPEKTDPVIAQGYSVAAIRTSNTFSPYTRYGDLFVGLCLAVFLLEGFLAQVKRKAGNV
jgi:apolipoprotein N-acyltransferase